jgi:hypothetical protein
MRATSGFRSTQPFGTAPANGGFRSIWAIWGQYSESSVVLGASHKYTGRSSRLIDEGDDLHWPPAPLRGQHPCAECLADPTRFERATFAFGGRFPRFAQSCSELLGFDKILILRAFLVDCVWLGLTLSALSCYPSVIPCGSG